VPFLYDPDVTPHLSAGDLYKAFGVSQSNALAKSKTARDLLEIDRLSLEWCLPTRVPEHPMAWMVITEIGLMIDARQLPREKQAMLFDAGLIPFVHADRAQPEAAGDLVPDPSAQAPGAPIEPPVAASQKSPAPDVCPSPQIELF
jgi:hypothetical protein